MPRDPKDLSLSAPEQVVRRLADSEDLARGGGRAFGSANGAEGKEGKAGKDGATWYQGSGVPSLGTGKTGDFYYRTGTSDVYYKESESLWTIIANIKGEKGATGETGAGGKEGPAGSLENTDWKNSVRVATTANIATATALNPGDSLDGVTLAENDRVLVKDQTTKSQNGIWIVKASPSRALDADAAAELSGGSALYVEEGTKNKRRTFQVITPGNITPGTTAHEYQQLGYRDFGIIESSGALATITGEALVGDIVTYKPAAGIYWELIYTNEDSTYPWNPRGRQMEIVSLVVGSGTRNSATYGDCTTGVTTVPKVSVPLKGAYRIEHGAVAQLSGGASSNCFISIEVGATAPNSEDSAQHVGIDQFEGSTIRSHPIEKTALTAGTEIKQKYKGEVGTLAWQYAKRWVALVPIKVG